MMEKPRRFGCSGASASATSLGQPARPDHRGLFTMMGSLSLWGLTPWEDDGYPKKMNPPEVIPEGSGSGSAATVP